MSIDNGWVTVEGVRYVPEAPLKAEIARLQNVIKDQRAELDKLGDRFDAQSDEIARLQAALEEIAETIGYVEIRAIARKALAKEGK